MFCSLDPRSLLVEPGLDLARGVEIPRRKRAWRLGRRRTRCSRRAFGEQEGEFGYAGPVVSRNDMLIAPRRDVGAGTMAKLADVDDEVGLPPPLCLSRKAVEPRPEIVIGHRGATLEPLQLEQLVIQVFEQNPELIAVQLRADAGLACHQPASSLPVSRDGSPRYARRSSPLGGGGSAPRTPSPACGGG